MKLTILGAASPRFPLLLHSLLNRTELLFDTIHLYDIDTQKLALLDRTLLTRILASHRNTIRIVLCKTLEEALEGADYVFSSIRVGGQEQRIADELTAMRCSQIGQETVGVGGFFLALRTIPVVLQQVRLLEKVAPKATLINFTNPSGLVTQAVHSLTGFRKIIGICDAPQMVATYASEIYGCDAEDVLLHYYGINHLGWVYGMQLKGKEMLGDLIDTKLPLFFEKEPFYQDLESHIRKTRTIPNEYLYYYEHTKTIVENQKKSPLSRAQTIKILDEELYKALGAGTVDALDAFNHYMDARNGSYMALESGRDRSLPVFSLLEQHNANGYDAIALDVLSSVMGISKKPLILNIPNNGFDPALADDDVIEVSTLPRDGWFAPIGTASALHPSSWALLMQMKSYERKVIEAVASQSERNAIEALGMHPFVGADAASLYDCMRTGR